MMRLPSKLATESSDTLVWADRWMVLHETSREGHSKGYYPKARCSSTIAPVPLATMTQYGRGLCAKCWPATGAVY